MTTAVVLIEAERNALTTLGGELADLAREIAGVRLMLADVVTGRISGLGGVMRTQTMVAFEVFSKHDLESMFSIGE